MSNIFIFDACSLISVLTNEKGADTVKNLLEKAVNSEIIILMNKINFLEVYYYIYKKYDENRALELMDGTVWRLSVLCLQIPSWFSAV